MPDMHKIKVKPEEQGTRLVSFLASRFGLSGRKAKQLLDARLIFVNGKRVWMAKHPLSSGDTVSAPIRENLPEQKGAPSIPVLYENKDLLVVNKPAGLVSNRSARSVEALLQRQRKQPGLKAAHRLDRETSGCLIIALNPACFERLVKLFKDRQVKKTYLALVAGRVPFKHKVLTDPIEGREAISEVAVLQAGRKASLLEITPETGRKHQIRIHLSRTGHPVLGEKKYQTARQPESFHGITRHLLHASTLSFPHPVTGQPVTCEAPLPDDFVHWMQQSGITG